MQNHYVNHNRRILLAVASDEHRVWQKKNHVIALKKAKRNSTMIGKTLTSLSQLKGLR